MPRPIASTRPLTSAPRPVVASRTAVGTRPYVPYGPIPGVPLEKWTFETWFQISNIASGADIFFSYWGGGVNFEQAWRFGVMNSTGLIQFINGGSSGLIGAAILANAPHHVAFTATAYGASMRLWLDGTEVVPSFSYLPWLGLGSSYGLVLGFGPYSGPGPQRHQGPMRISKIDRYSANFVPTVSWVTDANTLGLWNLTEGSGAVANDSSGNGLKLTLNGAPTWTTINGGLVPALSFNGTSQSASAVATPKFWL